jgi:hypothetical protein
LIFNEHFNYGESARTLRSFIADVTTELCNLDKQAISTIEETKELIEVIATKIYLSIDSEFSLN